MKFTQYICYLRPDQREYLTGQKSLGVSSVSGLIREAIDLHRELRGGGDRPANNLTSALCQMIDTMEPGELQQAVKAVWAIREAFQAGLRSRKSADGGKGATAPPRSGKPTRPRARPLERARRPREEPSAAGGGAEGQ